MNHGSFAARLETAAREVERELALLLDFGPDVPPRLGEAMRYSVLGAGKRLRPFLVVAAGGLGDADPRACLRVGAAVELIHCYSLVHDDLPAMDDAELRRGRPTCHRAFDEATAILAADALIALAFEVLAREDWPCPPEVRAAVIGGLAVASGAEGMCGGQMLDLQSGSGFTGEAELTRLQQLKTGAMIAFALDAGCLLAGLDNGQRAAVRSYGRTLGLAFQIQDDLLDAVGSAAETGKVAGKDSALGRATFVSLLGVEGARGRLRDLRREAVGALDSLGPSATVLIELFDFVISRRS
jgi:farnesyl diphosphate synthase